MKRTGMVTRTLELGKRVAFEGTSESYLEDLEQELTDAGFTGPRAVSARERRYVHPGGAVARIFHACADGRNRAYIYPAPSGESAEPRDPDLFAGDGDLDAEPAANEEGDGDHRDPHADGTGDPTTPHGNE